MRIGIVTIWSIVLFFGALSPQISVGATVQLSAAASMTDAIKALIMDFGKRHPDAEILANFAASGALAKQIEQGAPADIYISANRTWMDYLAEKELIATNSERIFCYNTLVFVGDPRLGPITLADIADLELIAIGTPASVPAGHYAKQALIGSGLWDSLAESNRLMMAKDVRQALIYAERGEVDGAFVYKTDALLAKNASILFSVPDKLYDRVVYPIALTPMGTDNQAARVLFDYLKTPAAAAIIAGFGFEPAH
ncbi:molybdate ABC transporter substrate-binding protein [bacterium]|nr:molybdate ABC transporter substrate-binding protein [bacterium]